MMSDLRRGDKLALPNQTEHYWEVFRHDCGYLTRGCSTPWSVWDQASSGTLRMTSRDRGSRDPCFATVLEICIRFDQSEG